MLDEDDFIDQHVVHVHTYNIGTHIFMYAYFLLIYVYIFLTGLAFPAIVGQIRTF